MNLDVCQAQKNSVPEAEYQPLAVCVNPGKTGI
jgi:hypothetical protein